MNKKTKILIGIGILGIGGYLYWKSRKSFANAGGFGSILQPRQQTPTCAIGYYWNSATRSCVKRECAGAGMSDLCRCYDRACDKCSCPQTIPELIYAGIPNIVPNVPTPTP